MTYACKHGETSLETNEPKNDLLPQTTYQSTNNHQKDGSPAAVAV